MNNDLEEMEITFDETDIEQIFGGESVAAKYDKDSNRQSARLKEQQTCASDNLS